MSNRTIHTSTIDKYEGVISELFYSIKNKENKKFRGRKGLSTNFIALLKELSIIGETERNKFYWSAHHGYSFRELSELYCNASKEKNEISIKNIALKKEAGTYSPYKKKTFKEGRKVKLSETISRTIYTEPIQKSTPTISETDIRSDSVPAEIKNGCRIELSTEDTLDLYTLFLFLESSSHQLSVSSTTVDLISRTKDLLRKQLL